MQPDLTEIACVIDRSGSMASLRADAVGGFNTFLEAQQKLPGRARLTLVLFDHEYLVPYRGVPLAAVPPLDEETYVPRGQTALLDAIGHTIDDLGRRLHEMPVAERPATVIVVILTDGHENASERYTSERVAQMIRHQQEVYSWEFVFLAANQDAITAAAALAIDAHDAVSWAPTARGVHAAYAALNETVMYRRGMRPPSGKAAGH